MGTLFQREPLAALMESGLEALLRDHWREIAHDRDVIELAPDWDEYLKAEREGRFVAFSLRDDDALIGYNCFYVLRSMHYRNAIFATNDVIYLRPDRRGADGVLLILEAEKALRAMGTAKIFYHVKTDAVLGSPDGDSLEAVESRMEVEERVGEILPDVLFEAAGDRTLGGVLRHLGYGHFENHFGKLLIGKG